MTPGSAVRPAAILSILNLITNDAGQYDLVVTNVYGSTRAAW